MSYPSDSRSVYYEHDRLKPGDSPLPDTLVPFRSIECHTAGPGRFEVIENDNTRVLLEPVEWAVHEDGEEEKLQLRRFREYGELYYGCHDKIWGKQQWNMDRLTPLDEPLNQIPLTRLQAYRAWIMIFTINADGTWVHGRHVREPEWNKLALADFQLWRQQAQLIKMGICVLWKDGMLHSPNLGQGGRNYAIRDRNEKSFMTEAEWEIWNASRNVPNPPFNGYNTSSNLANVSYGITNTSSGLNNAPSNMTHPAVNSCKASDVPIWRRSAPVQDSIARVNINPQPFASMAQSNNGAPLANGSLLRFSQNQQRPSPLGRSEVAPYHFGTADALRQFNSPLREAPQGRSSTTTNGSAVQASNERRDNITQLSIRVRNYEPDRNTRPVITHKQPVQTSSTTQRQAVPGLASRPAQNVAHQTSTQERNYNTAPRKWRNATQPATSSENRNNNNSNGAGLSRGPRRPTPEFVKPSGYK